MPPLLSGYLRKRRFQAIAPYLRGNVLDLGCGLARVQILLTPDQEYVGVEGPPAFVKWLKSHYPGRQFYQRDLDQDKLDLDEAFDTILMAAIVEHLEHPEYILCQIPAYLKPGGRLLITTPTPLGDRFHRLGARLGLFWQSAVEEHETIFTRDTLAPLLHSNGLIIQHYERFLLGGNQLFVCQKAAENR